MKRIIVIVAALSILAAGTARGAGSPVEERTVSLPMSDGVALEASLFLPGGTGRFPAVLVRTPYGRQQHVTEARFWAAHGYAVVVQDTRGKWGSGGEYVPFLNEHADGMATLDWITAQPWSDGNVGMYGSSYLAFCQLVLASTGHPALKSIMPISGWISDDGQINRGGAHHIMLSIPWILHEESQTKRSIDDVELDDLFEYLPLIDAFDSIGLESKIWNEEFDFSHLEAYCASNIGIPALHITGWNDFVHNAALSVYSQAARGRAGSCQKLMVGPWFHDQFYTTYTEVGDEDFGPQSALGLERLMELALDWFDATVRNDRADLSAWPEVDLFVMGADEWREYERWPPAAVYDRKLFLGSASGANSSNGDGYLSDFPAVDGGYDSYVFDPNNPVPTFGGANFHFMLHLIGVKDQRDIEKRNDVLVYTTDPLADDMEIIGPVEAVLYASTGGRDTDFTAKLVEVRPNGYARIIEEGIIRASYRNGPDKRELLGPGRVYRLTVDMGTTAIVVPRGHRIRLEVSSSNFPKYDRNPNTGEEALEARTLVPVEQKVYFGGDRRSHLLLPVVEKQLTRF
ncbi:MAG: CocE/NonD family hydrolase [Candidatus Latescibacterota bacterium]|jgi:putative CocE/NonD family hydrolase